MGEIHTDMHAHAGRERTVKNHPHIEQIITKMGKEFEKEQTHVYV